jgi:uroporphyrinogen decarboxylase
MKSFTPRERMIVAMTNGVPDRVPVAPDISNMVPSRLTGKPFWEIYYFRDPPLWQAYMDAVRFYGLDGWFTEGDMQYQWPGSRYQAIEDMRKLADRWIVRYRGRIDDCPYTSEVTYTIYDPPTETEKMIKDLEAQWELVEKLLAPPVGYNPSRLRQQRAMVGEDAAFGISVNYPGFQSWFGWFEGGLEALTYAYHDHRELVLRMRALHDQMVLAQMEMILAERPDFVLLGASGTITMQSPRIARELCLPTIQKLTRMARQAGVPTMIHSCGKQRILVKWCAEETDLDSINPLEVAPMGDCDLAEIKRSFGSRLALMGNLHTTQTMLFGSPQDVRRASLEAILAAGENGGFILSTGDQCGRDTPDANIRAMVTAAEEFGRYPLDTDRIRQELARLQAGELLGSR